MQHQHREKHLVIVDKQLAEKLRKDHTETCFVCSTGKNIHIHVVHNEVTGDLCIAEQESSCVTVVYTMFIVCLVYFTNHV